MSNTEGQSYDPELLRTFLMQEAMREIEVLDPARRKQMQKNGFPCSKPHIQYVEHANDGVLDDGWMVDGSSFIWKVGLLAVVDSNKADWVKVLIATEHQPGCVEMMGKMDFPKGVNDDVGRVLNRVFSLFTKLDHPIFTEVQEPAAAEHVVKAEEVQDEDIFKRADTAYLGFRP